MIAFESGLDFLRYRFESPPVCRRPYAPLAAYNYIEPTVTEDVDILIAFDSGQHRPRSGLVNLGPILSYLREKGYSDFRNEGILIEGWAV